MHSLRKAIRPSILVALAAVASGGAYLLAKDEPAAAPSEPPSRAAVTAADDPFPRLGRAEPLPELAAPSATGAAVGAVDEPATDLDGDVD